MATTGFWPVHNHLKETIDYARNPDKTTDRRYLDDDLAAALQYAEADRKTDQRMYVTGINCSKHLAYQQMMAVKRKFGERGSVIAYHGYQSFQSGEVTPEEAHQIGIETARRMWGDRYQVVVTTHLNTDNIHSHFVVNSVSFVDGAKFRNKIGDHMELRKVSDAVCRERGKSVLTNSSFYRGEKKAYWVHKGGGMTHRDILRRDIDEALSKITYSKAFWKYLEGLGYTFARTEDYQHPSVIAPGWKRPVRLDSLGPEYTVDAIDRRLIENQRDPQLYAAVIYRPTRFPLDELEREYRKAMRMDGMQLAFALLIELLKLVIGYQEEATRVRPLSPAMRQEVRKLDKTLEQYHFLCDHGIDTTQDLTLFILAREKALAELEAERQKCRSRIRRAVTPEAAEAFKEHAKAVTARMEPVRKELAAARTAAQRYPQVLALLEDERTMEQQAMAKQQKRNKERGRYT